MIDKVDEVVKRWVEGVAKQAPVWMTSSLQASTERTVGLHLLGFADALAPRGARQTPPQIRLRYLIAAWDRTPEEEHRLLGALLFAALEHAEWEVDLASIDGSLWQGLGLAPRPAFALLVPVRSERVAPRAPLVGVPVRLQTVLAGPLRGRLLASDDVPLSAARVELLALGTTTETDADGHFSFGLVPRTPSRQRVRVIARGEVQDFTVEVGSAGAGPVTIMFKRPEG